MSKRIKTASVIVAVVMSALLVMSALFIVSNSVHSCNDADCRICLQMRNAVRSFGFGGAVGGAAFRVFAAVCLLAVIIGFCIRRFVSCTLVTLKTKLSD